MEEELYQITLSYACGGVVIQNNLVIRTAPIFNWMLGKDLNEIKNWVCKKKGQINKIN
jgi:hypothetical protein